MALRAADLWSSNVLPSLRSVGYPNPWSALFCVAPLGRAPPGRAFHYKSSLRCGLSAPIPHAAALRRPVPSNSLMQPPFPPTARLPVLQPPSRSRLPDSARPLQPPSPPPMAHPSTALTRKKNPPIIREDLTFFSH